MLNVKLRSPYRRLVELHSIPDHPRQTCALMDKLPVTLCFLSFEWHYLNFQLYISLLLIKRTFLRWKLRSALKLKLVRYYLLSIIFVFLTKPWTYFQICSWDKAHLLGLKTLLIVDDWFKTTAKIFTAIFSSNCSALLNCKHFLIILRKKKTIVILLFIANVINYN